MKEFATTYGTLFLSIITIIVAIGIPCYLTNRQNKIALFEKRYEVYKSFIDLESTAHSWKKAKAYILLYGDGISYNF